MHHDWLQKMWNLFLMLPNCFAKSDLYPLFDKIRPCLSNVIFENDWKLQMHLLEINQLGNPLISILMDWNKWNRYLVSF